MSVNVHFVKKMILFFCVIGHFYPNEYCALHRRHKNRDMIEQNASVIIITVLKKEG